MPGCVGSAPSSAGASSATPAPAPPAKDSAYTELIRLVSPWPTIPSSVSRRTTSESNPADVLEPMRYPPRRKGCSWR